MAYYNFYPVGLTSQDELKDHILRQEFTFSFKFKGLSRIHKRRNKQRNINRIRIAKNKTHRQWRKLALTIRKNCKVPKSMMAIIPDREPIGVLSPWTTGIYPVKQP